MTYWSNNSNCRV